MKWIDQMRRRSRGVELGTFGPTMLASAFREQSRKWGPHGSAVHQQSHPGNPQVLSQILEFACPDARVREKLTPTILHGLVDRYREGMKHAMLLVDVEREKRPYRNRRQGQEQRV